MMAKLKAGVLLVYRQRCGQVKPKEDSLPPFNLCDWLHVISECEFFLKYFLNWKGRKTHSIQDYESVIKLAQVAQEGCVD